MIRLTLNSLAKFFEKQHITTKILEATENLPFGTLFITLGDEDAGQYIIQIRILKQQMNDKEDSIGMKQNPKGYCHLQFTLPIDTTIQDKSMSELGRLILLINRTCNLPGFEFSEIEKVLYYRHATLVSGNEIDPYLLVSIIGSMMLSLTTFGDYLKDVARGSKSFRDVVEEFREIQQPVGKKS